MKSPPSAPSAKAGVPFDLALFGSAFRTTDRIRALARRGFVGGFLRREIQINNPDFNIF